MATRPRLLLCAVTMLLATALTATASAQDKPTPPPVTLEGWCVILGNYTYKDFGKADALAKKARDKGYANAGVYDTRDYPNFAWGELIVVAESVDERKVAAKSAKAAKKKKLRAFAKQCGEGDGVPLVAASAIKPLPALGKAPADAKSETAGVCFGWSTKHKAAACDIGSSSIQEGGDVTIRFIGHKAQPPITLAEWEGQSEEAFDGPKLDPKKLATAVKALKAGGYVHLDPDTIEPREAVPQGLLHWASPRFSVWYKRTTTPDGDEMNSWNSHDDLVQVRCGGVKAAWVGALSFTTYDDETTLNATRIPGQPYVILTMATDWGIEGDYGGETMAAVVNTETCEVLE